MNTWTGIYKKEFLNKYQIRHNESLGASFQDTSFWFLTLAFASRIIFTDTAFYLNRRDNPNSSVYNSNKVYAFCDVYDFIYQKIKPHLEIFNNVLGLYQFYRYKHYMSALNRSSEESCKEFIFRFKDDFYKSKMNGELDLTCFNNGGKSTLERILKDPYKFINEYLAQRPKSYSYSITSSKEVYDKENDIVVSVIIPLYNKEDYIKDCLDSIKNQTLKKIEVICIDDKSTDNSLKIVKNYKEIYQRLTIIENEINIGSGPSRNKGISVAKGKYICFMDADDFYPSNDILETLYSFAELKNVKICGGSFVRFQNNSFNQKFEKQFSKYIFKNEGLVTYADYQFEYGYHRFIYNREFIVNNNIFFPDLYRFQDPPFMVKAMILAQKFYCIPKITYAYRKDATPVNWTSRKVEDLIKGLTINLILSKENNFNILHASTVSKINSDFYKIINKFLTIRTLYLLVEFNKNIDSSLLKTAGYEIDTNKDYVIRILRSLLLNKASINTKFDINQIELKISNSKGEYKIYSMDRVNHSNQADFSALSNAYMQLQAKYQRKVLSLNKIKNGVSWKIGRCITYLPRLFFKLKK